MKKGFRFTVAASLLLLTPLAVLADSRPYYPYQSYDEYYREHSVTPPPEKKPATPPPAAVEVKPPPRPEQPLTIAKAPEFLFPPALGFGVAVGVPYDMFYLGKEFYLVSGGIWYKSNWYRGPWITVPETRLPPELRRQKLSKIRQIRNKEFAKYWKNKERYKGKRYRPEENKIPPSRGPLR